MFWLGLLACLLPRRYRRWWDEERLCSVVEGTVQCVACAGLVFVRLVHALQTEALPTTFGLAAAQSSGRTGLMATGALIGMTVLLNLWTILLVYFALEGYLRAFSAMITGETVSTLPAWLVARIHAALEPEPRVRAEIEP